MVSGAARVLQKSKKTNICAKIRWPVFSCPRNNWERCQFGLAVVDYILNIHKTSSDIMNHAHSKEGIYGITMLVNLCTTTLSSGNDCLRPPRYDIFVWYDEHIWIVLFAWKRPLSGFMQVTWAMMRPNSWCSRGPSGSKYVHLGHGCSAKHRMLETVNHFTGNATSSNDSRQHPPLRIVLLFSYCFGLSKKRLPLLYGTAKSRD